jgi:hypothetical protein
MIRLNIDDDVVLIAVMVWVVGALIIGVAFLITWWVTS